MRICKSHLMLLFVLALAFMQCKRDRSLKYLDAPLPAHFPKPEYNLNNNPITEQGFVLGRKLFYDPILSRDNTIACADCHISYSAFAHPDHPTSHGIDNLFGKRNALPVQNMLWNKTFFWDGGVPNLDLVPLNAIENPLEMDNTPEEILRRLNGSSQYRKMFAEAFPESDTINSAMMLQAFSQFMAMLVSADSKYDRIIQGKSGAAFTAQEQAGKQLFDQHCASCHSGVFFTDQSFRNNGIPNNVDFDGGRYEISALPQDKGKFKVPSLRNVALTGPYMHDGNYPTLEAVLQHYAAGVQDNPALDPLLKQNGNLGIRLTSDQQAQIISFLKTLTDDAFVRDKRFVE